jgi:hypothetical protein
VNEEYVSQLTDGFLKINHKDRVYLMPWTGSIQTARPFIATLLAGTSENALRKEVTYRIDSFYGTEFAGFHTSGAPQWHTIVNHLNAIGWVVERHFYTEADSEARILQIVAEDWWDTPRVHVHHENAV